ncbi:DEAD/DEAH box helicase [Pseudoalteromonas sp. MMG013]|uniref:DEAD/DEAH box helicase n=1 Tax=Pseudoalteromonas sp. MMG013 TaxID=2822687 RepID=UPI001B37C365|nr:DEAD/DEAH box helicase [Pseudoalteromonas sp. MMG013]MBQ4860383.1 DEAD/DEAH box helicase [Pseudoalteromonas sp. MMG013]
MSTQLSKEQLFALFEEIKQEQATQFPLSERFLKQYFNSALLVKAKEYLNNSQISYLDHLDDFSRIDSQVLGNFGNTFSQYIKISQVNNSARVEAQCTCSNNPKCRHIAAVLLKLKIEHSGGFGEAYLVNDWFNELIQLQQDSIQGANNVLLFVLEPHNKEVLLSPKLSPLRPDGLYPLGRPLSEQQLNSHIPLQDLLESDFRLFNWIRSQNPPGHFELFGRWGFTAIEQLVKTKRFYLQTQRQPLTLGHQQRLQFVWDMSQSNAQLCAQLSSIDNWLLLRTDPPMYVDTDKLVLGRINSELSAAEIAHLQSMPSVANDQLQQVMKRFSETFATDVIGSPKGVVAPTHSVHLRTRLNIVKLAPSKGFSLSIDKTDELSKTEYAKYIKRCEKVLLGLGLLIENGLFLLPVNDANGVHWFNHEVRPKLQSQNWLVDELTHELTVQTPKITLLLKRDKQHHILGKLMFDGKSILLDWDVTEPLDVNNLADLHQYIQIADQFYAIPTLTFNELLGLKARFSYYSSSQQFKFPLSYARKLYELESTTVVSSDAKLTDYLAELDSPQSIQFNIPSTDSQTFVLRDYQEQGVRWLKFLNKHQLGGILADDMGLGKTLQVIAYFISQHNTLMTQPSLIVCPTSLVSNWQNEFKRFAPHLTLTTVHGSDREKTLERVHTARFILTTYPLLKRDLHYYKGLKFDSIVLDEAQYIKNESAQVSKCVKQLQAEFKLCLSGTPVENNLLELKSLLDFVMPDVLGTKQQFKHYFQIPIEKEQDIARANELKALIAPFILRRTKVDVVKELPDKTELIKELEFTPEQANLYHSVQTKIEDKLLTLFKEQGAQKSKLVFLDALLKLRQICCHPQLVDKQVNSESAKFQWLCEHLPVMLSQGRKIIIFSQFTSVLELIAKQLTESDIGFSTLTGQTRNRERVISTFTEGLCDVFLISLKAGGTGLNLTQADTVIHFDPWWNPAVENQATDRAYRIGQDKPVFVYKLIMANSIEQKVHSMQLQKQALVDALFEDKSLNLSQFDETQMLEMLKS